MVDPSLAQLAADLVRAAATAGEAMRPALQSAAANIKDEWQSTWPWSGSKHLTLKAGGPSLRIGYTTTVGPMESAAEIGVNRGDASVTQKAGQLAHLIEFGSVYNSPHPGGAPALARNTPLFTLQMAAIAEALLGPGAVALTATQDASRFNRRASGQAWPGYE